MCGIIGYVGSNRAIPILEDGLANLEYRGYDSAGVALQHDGIDVYKQTGVVGDLSLPQSYQATCGIGHTRWSTHGEPTDANAHPHTGCNGEVAVVHNGIIENYDELKDSLDSHTFTSNTDTEVVAHLVEERLREGLGIREAVTDVVDLLEGSFALAIVSADFDGIVCVRHDNPLVVGYADDGNFVASDIPAFVEHSRTVTYLENGDIVTITGDNVHVFRRGEEVDVERETVEWDEGAAEKSGYEHYMLKEINEQPQAIRQAIAGRVNEKLSTADLDIEFAESYLESIEEIQFVGAGTSHFAGQYGAELLEEHAGVRATTEVASEYEFRRGRDPWRTLVVAVTQSGETADTLSALREANQAGARTLAVTNTVGSSASREADDVLYIQAGPEIGVAASKTFVSQVTTMTLFSVFVGRKRDTMTAEAAEEVLQHVRNLPGAIQQVLDKDEQVQTIAETYESSEAFFFTGRKLGTPVALEGALKLKEISYDHAEGYPAGELKHGPLAQVTEDTPVISLLTEGARPAETLKSAKEAKSRGAPIIGCGSIDTPSRQLDEVFEVPDAGKLEPLVATVFLQLFAYHVANLKGRAIDKPRNLAKSVTVE